MDESLLLPSSETRVDDEDDDEETLFFSSASSSSSSTRIIMNKMMTLKDAQLELEQRGFKIVIEPNSTQINCTIGRQIKGY
jgi:hypothetical protein